MREYEKVDVLDITNGVRLTTYILLGKSGEICLNGAAARLVQCGDLVIIAAYASMSEEEADDFHPSIVHVDHKNRIVERV